MSDTSDTPVFDGIESADGDAVTTDATSTEAGESEAGEQSSDLDGE